MSISPAVFGYVLSLLAVAVVAFIVGLRIGARARVQTPLSEEEEVAAALGVLRRHVERRALAELETSGAPIWTPDAARLAELSFGSPRDVSVAVGRNTKTSQRSSDHR